MSRLIRVPARLFTCSPAVDPVGRLGYRKYRDTNMDTMPFLHAGRLFTILFTDDLTFDEVREILDLLLAEDAFDSGDRGSPEDYNLDLAHASFNVWVLATSVAIQKI